MYAVHVHIVLFDTFFTPIKSTYGLAKLLGAGFLPAQTSIEGNGAQPESIEALGRGVR